MNSRKWNNAFSWFWINLVSNLVPIENQSAQVDNLSYILYITISYAFISRYHRLLVTLYKRSHKFIEIKYVSNCFSLRCDHCLGLPMWSFTMTSHKLMFGALDLQKKSIKYIATWCLHSMDASVFKLIPLQIRNWIWMSFY